MAERALLDTGVLVSFLHADDHAHDRSVGALKAFRGPLLTTEAVLTEAVYLLGRVRGGGILVPSSGESLLRCKALMSRYADVPMDFADATLVTLGDDVRTRRSTRWIGGGSRRIGPRQGRDSRFGHRVPTSVATTRRRFIPALIVTPAARLSRDRRTCRTH